MRGGAWGSPALGAPPAAIHPRHPPPCQPSTHGQRAALPAGAAHPPPPRSPPPLPHAAPADGPWREARVAADAAGYPPVPVAGSTADTPPPSHLPPAPRNHATAGRRGCPRRQRGGAPAGRAAPPPAWRAGAAVVLGEHPIKGAPPHPQWPPNGDSGHRPLPAGWSPRFLYGRRRRCVAVVAVAVGFTAAGGGGDGGGGDGRRTLCGGRRWWGGGGAGGGGGRRWLCGGRRRRGGWGWRRSPLALRRPAATGGVGPVAVAAGIAAAGGGRRWHCGGRRRRACPVSCINGGFYESRPV